MLKAKIKKHQLHFKRPAGTSRGVYTTRDVWYLIVWDDENPVQIGIGECAPLPDLSCDFDEHYETKLQEVCDGIDDVFEWLDEGLREYPSILFGLETALMDLQMGHHHQLYDTSFSQGKEGILMNGLIWMGEPDDMREQIQDKLKQGFTCIKLKIGAQDIEEELAIIKGIRDEFPADQLEIRVDANGAFDKDMVMPILERLGELGIHSIEQPIAPGQIGGMRFLARKSPIAIAFDEELIGIHDIDEKRQLLKNTKPQYLILKPSLHGGMSGCQEWIELAEAKKIDWWVTSALESNIGLNAIAQWTASLGVSMPQGLGTGQLFSNNIPSPLEVRGERLYYNTDKDWNLSSIFND